LLIECAAAKIRLIRIGAFQEFGVERTAAQYKFSRTLSMPGGSYIDDDNTLVEG